MSQVIGSLAIRYCEVQYNKAVCAGLHEINRCVIAIVLFCLLAISNNCFYSILKYFDLWQIRGLQCQILSFCDRYTLSRNAFNVLDYCTTKYLVVFGVDQDNFHESAPPCLQKVFDFSLVFLIIRRDGWYKLWMQFAHFQRRLHL